MKKKQTTFIAGGTSQQWRDDAGAADDITAARVDTNGGGWLYDRGPEPWWTFGDGFQGTVSNALANYMETKVDSCFVWTKQNTNQTYYLIEQNGKLFYFWGNKGSISAADFFKDWVLIDSKRHIPNSNEAGTQYVPFGNRLLIINGYDKPIWFYGREKSRDFGFLIQTPSPEVLDIEPSYLSGSTRLAQGTASPNFTSAGLGLGVRDDNQSNTYAYKLAFVRDTGAVSPLSAPAYVNWSREGVAATAKRFGVYLNDLPTGPDGTVARIIYRTKNQLVPDSSLSPSDGVFYFVKQINDNFSEEFIDVIPDTALIVPASDSISTTIDTAYQYGAAWNNRMWLAGGLNHSTRIIYSEAGIPEQFGTFNYFDVGSTTGGAITQLMAYYNNLLVFRESAIEIIRPNGSSFTLSQLSPSIGTTGSNTVALTPNGVMFLAKDGIYQITGGLDGGSQVSIKKVSVRIGKEIARVSDAALPRAVAAYSAREREFWVHYPQRGASIPTRGIVLHTDTGQFSFRHSIDKTSNYKYQFTAMAVDANGYFVLGTKPTWLLSGSASDSTTVGATGYLVGLHVWAGIEGAGWSLTLDSDTEQTLTYSSAQVAKDDQIWQSNWIHFGDLKTRVFYVEAEMVSYGDNAIELEWSYDYDDRWNSAGTQKPTKVETVFTTKEDAVLGPADTSVTKVPFTIGTSAVNSPKLVRVRWDVSTGLVDNFRFRLKSNDTMHLLRYNMYSDSKQQLTRNQRGIV